jgi:hypothetical protein
MSLSTKIGLPHAIQQILNDQADEANNNKAIDMWTSQAEGKYQAQMQSLNSNISFLTYDNILALTNLIRKTCRFYGNVYIS